MKKVLFLVFTIKIFSAPAPSLLYGEEALLGDKNHVYSLLTVAENTGNYFTNKEYMYLIEYNQNGIFKSKKLIRSGIFGYNAETSICCYRSDSKINKSIFNNIVSESLYTPYTYVLPHISEYINENKTNDIFYYFDKKGLNIFGKSDDEEMHELYISFDEIEKHIKQLSLNYTMTINGRVKYENMIFENYKSEEDEENAEDFYDNFSLNKVVVFENIEGFQIHYDDGGEETANLDIIIFKPKEEINNWRYHNKSY